MVTRSILFESCNHHQGTMIRKTPMPRFMERCTLSNYLEHPKCALLEGHQNIKLYPSRRPFGHFQHLIGAQQKHSDSVTSPGHSRNIQTASPHWGTAETPRQRHLTGAQQKHSDSVTSPGHSRNTQTASPHWGTAETPRQRHLTGAQQKHSDSVTSLGHSRNIQTASSLWGTAETFRQRHLTGAGEVTLSGCFCCAPVR